MLSRASAATATTVKRDLPHDPPTTSQAAGILVLERRVGEKIMIGDEIEVILIETRHNKAKIGIVAPAHVAIHRLEVWLERRGGRRRRPR